MPPALGSAATPVAISVLIELANLAAVTLSSKILTVVTAFAASSATVIAFAATSSATITSTPSLAEVIALSAMWAVAILPST